MASGDPGAEIRLLASDMPPKATAKRVIKKPAFKKPAKKDDKKQADEVPGFDEDWSFDMLLWNRVREQRCEANVAANWLAAGEIDNSAGLSEWTIPRDDDEKRDDDKSHALSL